ncbi:hypothetical protein H4R34_002613 [Dimargaris verticillata]|uniref:Protein phosphatase 1 regulatory subunit 7 n=1 Tax=Dimargaris verticillata TaxID=2761393 RepID=A0A9W8E9U2_9FUNG|nr:hypothetical protein H4R34_002613 [Dimargaris verticillata]
MRITAAALSQFQSVPLGEVQTLDLSNKNIDYIADISNCIDLRKLNLSKNALASTEAIQGILDLTSLTWLNLAHNQLPKCDVIRYMSRLTVLNISHNQLNRVPLTITSCPDIKALILNHNQIVAVEHVGDLPQLATLVLSHNRIETLPPLKRNTALIKLSVAHNAIRTIPDFSHLTQLKELRLNDNKIMAIPDTLGKCLALEILDLGNNFISEWGEITKLAVLKRLVNLNLKGNSLCDHPNYRDLVLQHLPHLRILDGVRFDPKFLQRKQKRFEQQRETTTTKRQAPVEEGSTSPSDAGKKHRRPRDTSERSRPYPRKGFTYRKPKRQY